MVGIKRLEKTRYTVDAEKLYEALKETLYAQGINDELGAVVGTLKRYIDHAESLGYRNHFHVTARNEREALSKAFARILPNTRTAEEMKEMEMPVIISRSGKRYSPKQIYFNTFMNAAKSHAKKRAFLKPGRTVIPKKNSELVKGLSNFYLDRDLSDYRKLHKSGKIDRANEFYARHDIPYLVYPTDRAPTKALMSERLTERLGKNKYRQNLAIYHSIADKQPLQLKLSF